MATLNFIFYQNRAVIQWRAQQNIVGGRFKS